MTNEASRLRFKIDRRYDVVTDMFHCQLSIGNSKDQLCVGLQWTDDPPTWQSVLAEARKLRAIFLNRFP